jgi:hypothetical protein
MKNCTDITMILDKSGSMMGVTSDTIGGFNTFIEKQKEDKNEALFSLFQFATKLEENYVARKIQYADKLTNETYIANGLSTALLDAIGQVINKVGERLRNIKEEDRPDKILIAVQTDGFENDSKEFKKEQIEKMIKHQEEKYNWKFVFLGAGLDVVQQGMNLGFSANNSFAYGNNSAGNIAMYGSFSNSISQLRELDSEVYCSTQVFTDDDKKAGEQTII